MIRHITKYLFHRATWQRLPMLPRTYSTDYDPALVDEDTATVMRLAHVRCPQGVDKLKRKYRVETTRELARELAWRHRPRYLKSRAVGLVRRVLGVTAYDPMREIARRHMKRGRRW